MQKQIISEKFENLMTELNKVFGKREIPLPEGYFSLLKSEISTIVTQNYPDYTNEFFKSLYFKKDELFKGITIGDRNRIKQIPMVIVASMGMGKTTLAKNIIYHLYQKYGENDCVAVYTREYSIGDLIRLAFNDDKNPALKGKRIRILVFDDATSEKLSIQDQKKFFRLRHKMKEGTGMSEGAIYTIFCTHDWYSLDRTIRRIVTRSVYLSVPPLDKYSRKDYGRVIGEEAVEALQEIFAKAEKEDKYKGLGFVFLPSKPDRKHDVGYILFDEVPVKMHILK